MSKPLSINNLPYILPNNRKEQLKVLSKIVGIPISFVENGGEKEVNALCGAILYRHLDRHQRIEALSLIRDLSNKPLLGKLITVAIEPTYVNINWGIWSFTREELLSDKNFHSQVDNLASYIGIGSSMISGKDLITKVWKEKKLTKGGIVTLVIWGSVLFNKSELSKVNNEIQRRSSVRTISIQ